MRFAVGLISIALAAQVHAATCTVTAMRLLVSSSGFNVPLGGPVIGHAIPVEVSEGAGTFQMDFSGMPGAGFEISGVANTISFDPGAVSGTIDAAGNVSLPPMPVHFTTDLAPGADLGSQELLTTTLAAVTLSGQDYATEGTALDFSTGAIQLTGQGVVNNAPVVGTSTTGVAITCTLAPIPAQDQLPKASTTVARGVGKPGKPVSGQVVGDSLTLKAKIKTGGVPIDPTKDVFVRIRVASDDVLLIRVPAGGLAQKGKKFSASDTDESAIHIITGRKKDGDTLADVTSSLKVVTGKKSVALLLKESGLDLSPLANGAAATATIAIGGVQASDDVTVKASTKKIVLK